MSPPVIYTFRRCPYAMRARLAIELCDIEVEYREILLRDKPRDMLEYSAKGTVPVLVLNEKTEQTKVIDESLEIMLWAMNEKPNNKLSPKNMEVALNLIQHHDNAFKPLLDRYKYAIRYPEKSEEEHRAACLPFLKELDTLLKESPYLLSTHVNLTDIAIFPFIRQFRGVDPHWFDALPLDQLKAWLDINLSAEYFKNIMVKRELWKS